MSNYEIQLGVKLDTGSIASQINEAEIMEWRAFISN